jgi:hypothetical protein
LTTAGIWVEREVPWPCWPELALSEWVRNCNDPALTETVHRALEVKYPKDKKKKKKKKLVMHGRSIRDAATIPSLLQVLVHPDYALG